MEAIRLGLVGSGGMARRRAAAFAAMEGCKLTAVAARNAHTGAELAQRHEVELLGHWQALIERADIDAVAICTNNDSHAPITAAALKAGKHVFLEYPLARRLDEGEALVDLARATGKVLRVAHPEVVSAEHRQFKEAAASLGGLLVALFTRLTPGRGGAPRSAVQPARFWPANFVFRLSRLSAGRFVRARLLGLRAMLTTTA